ncbi:uncharacterized protein KGF55_001775 [Candida pseudojiufengensis]|uniref:uncharacterized protein n=1 Tax=Candida pseudojiufengensis TaxID=497109 RepID=UPI002225A0CA|nr:uncharacterized protein KGF55_001775 [Candida pseudojiufengensis]KAI5964706.1 hypothetical protein KGF55_001775 [Candida pseudojiufengensis]
MVHEKGPVEPSQPSDHHTEQQNLNSESPDSPHDYHPNNEDDSLTSISSSAISNASPTNLEDPIAYRTNNVDPINDDTVCNEYYPAGDNRNLANTLILEEPTRKIPWWRKAYDIVYPGYVINHLNYQSFKVVAQSWLYVWPVTILTIVPSTSEWLGAAPYLVLIVAFIAISGGSSIILNVISSCAIMIGVMISFVHHIVRSKIINDIKGGITQQQLVQQLIDEGTCQLGPQLELCVQDQIFSGRYIQTKTVAITILSMISNTLILGNIRSIHPLWNLSYIFGQIGNVIFSCYGHFSPLYAPLQVGLTVIKPVGVSLVFKVAAAIFIFPSTSNFRYISAAIKSIGGLKKACSNNTRLFNTMRPSAPNFANYKSFKKEITAIRAKMAPLEVLASTIWLEYSYGRFDVGDVGQFRSLFKNLITSSASYAHFYQLLQERTFFAKDDFSITRRKSSVSSFAHGHAKLFSAFHDSYKKVGEYENKKRIKILRNRIMQHGEGHRIGVTQIDMIAKYLTEHFGPVLDTADKGFDVIIEWLTAANEFRLYALIPGKWDKHVRKQEEMALKVKAIKKEIVDMIAKYDDTETLKSLMIDNSRTEDALLFLISQGVLFLQIARLQCQNLLELLDFCTDLDERRPTPKFITTFTKTKYFKPRHLSSDLDEELPDYLKSNVERRNADNLPPANWFQFCGLHILKFIKFLLSDKLWFWIRAGGLICIGAIPYFVRTTAHWYYGRRMVWLVIMIAVSISETSGQTIYVFVSKLVYTFSGCLLGLVGWYISCGNGHGNYYGFGAVTAVLYLYLIFFRHFSIHQTLLPQILFGVTTVLVLGTSWLDVTDGQQANVGYGWTPAYLRFLGVVIGLCIGSLAAIVPKPRSSKSLVRRTLGNALFEIGNLHCDVSKFAMRRLDDPTFHIQERHDLLITRFRYLFMKIAGLNKLLVPLKFELPIAGYWPESKYVRLQGLLTDTVQLYLMLLVAFNQLEDPRAWIPIIVKRAGLCYSDLDAEIFSLVHMASGALKSKEALPKITEANISVKHMELLRNQWGINKISLSERFYSSPTKGTTNDHSKLTEHLDYDKFLSKDGQLNILSLLLAHMIYNRLDEIMIVVKGLVGEVFDLDEQILIDEIDLDGEKFQNQEEAVLLKHL